MASHVMKNMASSPAPGMSNEKHQRNSDRRVFEPKTLQTWSGSANYSDATFGKIMYVHM